MFKNLYDSSETIEIKFQSADSNLFRLIDGVLFTAYEIWTGTGKTGTQLVDGTDYSPGGQSTSASAVKGETVYSGFQITNVSYQSIDLYATVTWVGNLGNADAFSQEAVTVDADYTFIGRERIINVDAATATIDLYTLKQGQHLTIRKINSGAGTITINPPAGMTFTRAGLSSVTLTSDGDFWEFEPISSTRIELVDGVDRGSGYRKLAKNIMHVFENNEDLTGFNFSASSYKTITFTKPFSSTPDIQISPRRNASDTVDVTVRFGAIYGSTQFNLAHNQGGATAVQASWIAIGEWY